MGSQREVPGRKASGTVDCVTTSGNPPGTLPVSQGCGCSSPKMQELKARYKALRLTNSDAEIQSGDKR